MKHSYVLDCKHDDYEANRYGTNYVVKWSISVKRNIELIKFNFLFAYNFIPQHKGCQEIYIVIESSFQLISIGFT
jgi:hypothetical protein